jgi:hypothetical protein
MKRITIAGLCLAAALLTSALGAAGASATAPEYGRCLKVVKVGKTYNGAYTDSKCTKKSETNTGKFEWTPGAAKHKFTSAGGAGILETVGTAKVECKTETSDGEFVPGNNKEEAGVVVRFTGCKSFGFNCSTPKAVEGELVTNELEGTVGWANKAAKKTDLELYPGKTAGGQFIEFTCGGLLVKVRGKVLVPIKNDKMTETETLKFKAKHGKQIPETWEESGSPQILESAFSNLGGKYEQAGQTIKSTVKGEEKLELNAVV